MQQWLFSSATGIQGYNSRSTAGRQGTQHGVFAYVPAVPEADENDRAQPVDDRGAEGESAGEESRRLPETDETSRLVAVV